MKTAPDLAPTETDMVMANGNPPGLTRYDPAGMEPDFLFEVLNALCSGDRNNVVTLC